MVQHERGMGVQGFDNIERRDAPGTAATLHRAARIDERGAVILFDEFRRDQPDDADTPLRVPDEEQAI